MTVTQQNLEEVVNELIEIRKAGEFDAQSDCFTLTGEDEFKILSILCVKLYDLMHEYDIVAKYFSEKE